MRVEDPREIDQSSGNTAALGRGKSQRYRKKWEGQKLSGGVVVVVVVVEMWDRHRAWRGSIDRQKARKEEKAYLKRLCL